MIGGQRPEPWAAISSPRAEASASSLSRRAVEALAESLDQAAARFRRLGNRALGSDPGFPRGGEIGLGALEGMVGLSQRSFRRGQAVRRLAPRRRRDFERVHQRLALGGDLRGPARQRLDLRLERLAALRQAGELALGRLGARQPGLTLLLDGHQALAAGLGFAAKTLGGAAAFDEMTALLRQQGLQLAEPRARLAQIGQAGALLGHDRGFLFTLGQARIRRSRGLVEGRQPSIELRGARRRTASPKRKPH